AQYPFTGLSVPSYLTGKIYRTGSLKDFQLEAKTGGLSEILRQAGYSTASYSPNRTGFWSHNNASRIFATSDAFKGDVEKTFALVSAVRAAPEPLRMDVQHFVSRVLWGGQNDYSYYGRKSVPLMEQFLADEEGRSGEGHYNYVHLLLPHPTFIWSGDCVIEGQTNYLEQAECASRLMKRFIAKLKDLGRYENSIILLHSDHGSRLDSDSANPVTTFTQQVKSAYASPDNEYSASEVINKLNALFLIKPMGEGKRPLEVSEQIVQLVDIPATVLGLLGMEAPLGEGKEIFSNYQERDVPVFVPTLSISTIRNQTNLSGEEEKVGVFNHFSFSRERGWEIHPEIDIFHEGW
ncbi:MAG: sulfatase-like hydrolase/transferase, partial [Boseongicola sp.]